VLRAVSESLLKPRPDLTGVEPAAALSYESNSAGTAYVFHLRTNARYWDGTPVKAADFVYAWQRLIDPRLAAPSEGLFADAILNGQRVSLMDPQRDKATIDTALGTLGLKAIDDYTFQVQLAHPDRLRLASAMPAAAPHSQDARHAKRRQVVDGATGHSSRTVLPSDRDGQQGSHQVERQHQLLGCAARANVSTSRSSTTGRWRSRSSERRARRDGRSSPPSSGVAGDSTLNRQLIKTPNLTVFWVLFRVNSHR
jgi:hypothetical protein